MHMATPRTRDTFFGNAKSSMAFLIDGKAIMKKTLAEAVSELTANGNELNEQARVVVVQARLELYRGELQKCEELIEKAECITYLLEILMLNFESEYGEQFRILEGLLSK